MLEKTQKFAQEVFSHLAGALVSGMIYLGERMGLYRALNGAGPLTSEELARKTGLNERWVREWLYQQAAANVIDYKGESRFELSPEAALVLADENSPFFLAGGFCAFPQQMALLNELPRSFKSGLGLSYDQFGSEVNVGVERLLAPWFRTQLVPSALPRLDGVVAKLQCRRQSSGCRMRRRRCNNRDGKGLPAVGVSRLRYRQVAAPARRRKRTEGRSKERASARRGRRSSAW